MLNIDNKYLERRIEKRDFILDKNTPNFVNNNDHNVFFIKRYEGYFNDLLQARGYVFVNEVLIALGIDPTQGGQLAGWRGHAAAIEIKITQTRYLGMDVQEYFIHLNHDGFILDALKD